MLLGLGLLVMAYLLVILIVVGSTVNIAQWIKRKLTPQVNTLTLNNSNQFQRGDRLQISEECDFIVCGLMPPTRVYVRKWFWFDSVKYWTSCWIRRNTERVQRLFAGG